MLRQNVPVVIRIVNFDDGLHSMYAPSLGVNILALPGKHATPEAKEQPGAVGLEEYTENGVVPHVTTYTFTPTKAGFFRWHCTIPCDGGRTKHWAMSESKYGPDQNGYMAGYFVVR